jgi:hypothetical protein
MQMISLASKKYGTVNIKMVNVIHFPFYVYVTAHNSVQNESNFFKRCVLFLTILTGERGLCLFTCESINDGCFSLSSWSCLRCAAFITVLKSVAENTLWWRWESGVTCSDRCDGVSGDPGVLLLSGRDGGVSRGSSDARWPTGDGLSCVSQSNLVVNKL